jgi:succinate dehydrogenase/fumarate reductase flavoprotein subunit
MHLGGALIMRRMDENRRRFLKGAALGVVVGAVGSSVPLTALTGRQEIYWKIPERWDRETDVAVLGFGAAGASAAIEAASNRANVLVLDKAATPGATTFMSGGNFVALNARIQREKGLDQDVQAYYNHVKEEMERVHWAQLFPEERDMKYIARSGEELADWLELMGVSFSRVTGTSLAVEGGGPKLMGLLQKAAAEKGAVIESETAATQLIARPDSGTVLGVVGTQNGTKLFIKARRGVVITTGGFSVNKEMLKQHNPVGYASVPTTAETNTGDGIAMVQALGGATSAMHVASGPPAILQAGSRMQYFGMRTSSIYVNERGNRFCDESGPAEEQNDLIFGQTGSHAWLLTDSAQLAKSKGRGIHSSFSDDLEREVSLGKVKKGTLDSLATQLLVGRENLLVTINRWNEWAKNGKQDRDFGRPDSPTFSFVALEGPTYYGVEIVPGISETLGGVIANGDSAVIDVEGKLIPKLYAAGDVVAEGLISTLGEAMFFGKMAGRKAAEEAPWS